MRGRSFGSVARRRSRGQYSTPRAIARRMARFLRLNRPATVLDPACGTGELLLAVAKQYDSRGVRLVGIDRDLQILERCRANLESSGTSFELIHGDYFDVDLRSLKRRRGTLYVIMNPPFRGYGELSETARHRIADRVPGLSGRFNLAHAFLARTFSVLEPNKVVALLPGNWVGAKYSQLSPAIPTSGFTWRPLPDATFKGVTTTSGLLVTRGSTTTRGDGKPTGVQPTNLAVRVRQGVATGADQTFLSLSHPHPRWGHVTRAARGRDVARGLSLPKLPQIWIPPNGGGDHRVVFRWLPAGARHELSNRYSVLKRGKSCLDFHENIPSWFLGTPKILIPEVCKKLSILVDRRGEILPLHSSIAVRVDSKLDVDSLAELLRTPKFWETLRNRSMRMAGGAIRITTPTLRMLLTEMASSPGHQRWA
jgi:SAM-dependent methyltransferase